MPPKKDFAREEKLDMLQGIPIYSRKYKQKIFVNKRMFYEYGPIPAPIINDRPSEYQTDRLCDDLFYEEFGVEPDNQSIANIAEILLGDFGNTN